MTDWGAYEFVLVDDSNVGHDDARCRTRNKREKIADGPPWPCSVCVTLPGVRPPRTKYGRTLEMKMKELFG